MQYLKLSSGQEIPQLGAGLARIPRPQIVPTVSKAIDLGYRHFDTAQKYGHESLLGEAIKASGIPREQFFVTTKLNPAHHRPRACRHAVEASLRRLNLGYIDLFLIHSPSHLQHGEEFVETWRILEEAAAGDRVRAIGVSNFEPWRLEVLAAHSEVRPVLNQIESHPYFPNSATAAYGEARDIVTAAWSPLALGLVLDDVTVAEIAERLGRSPAQVVLRWHVQRGSVVVPKSTVREELEQNSRIFEFELSDADMAAIDALDLGEPGRTGDHPDNLPRPTLQDRVRLRTRLRQYVSFV